MGNRQYFNFSEKHLMLRYLQYNITIPNIKCKYHYYIFVIYCSFHGPTVTVGLKLYWTLQIFIKSVSVNRNFWKFLFARLPLIGLNLLFSKLRWFMCFNWLVKNQTTLGCNHRKTFTSSDGTIHLCWHLIRW